MGKRKPRLPGLSSETVDELAVRLDEVAAHLDALEALLEATPPLATARRGQMQRLRGPDEARALRGVLEYASRRPELFTSLASAGSDGNTFDVDVLLRRLDHVQQLSHVAARAGALQTRLADAALYMTHLVKPPALAAYRIGKACAGTHADDKLLSPAIELYRDMSVRAAKTLARKTKKAR